MSYIKNASSRCRICGEFYKDYYCHTFVYYCGIDNIDKNFTICGDCLNDAVEEIDTDTAEAITAEEIEQNEQPIVIGNDYDAYPTIG